MNTPEQLIREINSVVFTGDVERIPSLVHPDFVHHGPTGDQAGQSAFADYITFFRTAFPDLDGRIEGVIADGDRISWRVYGTGTHAGEFMGVAPTGRKITYTGIDQGRMHADGRVAEHWGGVDLFGLMAQLQ